jgi:magnesium chelatase subunit D
MGIPVPFSGISGLRHAKRALLMLAVEPALKGVLLAGAPGSGKSALARAWGALLGERFTEVPAGVTEERLVGGLDLERALSTGQRAIETGLLGRADGGIVYLDNAHLCEPRIAQQIAGALDSGIVRLEREGLSAGIPSRFRLVASVSPRDAGISPKLAASLGLHVTEPPPSSRRGRIAVLRIAALCEQAPREFTACHDARTAALRTRLEAARDRLPDVQISPEGERRLLSTAMRLGIEGHRADLFAIRAARAHAALCGRVMAGEADLEAAMRFVLYPRASAGPSSRANANPETEEGSESGGTTAPDSGDELNIAAAPASLPDGLLDWEAQAARSKGAASRGRRQMAGFARGRAARAVAKAPRGSRIAVSATVRAAAPFQSLREKPSGMSMRVEAADLRFQQFRQKPGILVVFAVDGSGSMAAHRMHQVKGAAISLLEKAHLYRAKVGLITFRGSTATVLLPPTRSVALARRAIEAMPAGGGTPLAAGLAAALRLIEGGPTAGRSAALLVLLTDGRANVARGTASVREDLAGVCAEFRAARTPSVVIDSGNRLTSIGEAEQVAKLLGGRYVPLPRFDAGGIHRAIEGELRAIHGDRGGG